MASRLRSRRFLWVLVRAGLFFGIVIGLLAGGLTASLLRWLAGRLGMHLWPLPLLIPAMVVGAGLVCGLLIAFTDYRLTRGTPEERLDPVGAVRQRVTLEIPAAPDDALAAISRIAFDDLDWAIADREEGHLTLRVPRSFRSFGEEVTVDLHPTPSGSAVLIDSHPLSFVVVVDYNKNRENALRLREALIERIGRVPRSPA